MHRSVSFIAAVCCVTAINTHDTQSQVSVSGAADVEERHIRGTSNENQEVLFVSGSAPKKPSLDLLQEGVLLEKAENAQSAESKHVQAAIGAIFLCTMAYLVWSPNAPAILVVLGWGASSISMSLLNKQATIVFPTAALLVALQMGITDLSLLAVEGRSMKCEKYSDLFKWCIVPFFYATVLFSGMWALKVTTVSTVLVLRNCLPLFTLAAEKVLLNSQTKITVPIVASLLVAVLGTVLYAWNNVSVSANAVGFILLNCCLVVGDRLSQRHFLSDPTFTLSPSMCLLVNNVVGIAIMALMALCTNEMPQWPSALSEADQQAWMWIIITGLNGCFLGYLAIRTQKMVSATSFLVLQNANKVLLILLSVAIFGDVVTGLPLCGCILSMLGSAWYGSLCLKPDDKGKK